MKRLIRSLTLENVLSFGGSVTIALGNLNVLVGPNGSGKTNLLDTIGLLRACPSDVERYMRQNGGVHAWVYKDFAPEQLAVTATLGLPSLKANVAHRLEIGIDGVRAVVDFERIFPADSSDGEFFFMNTTHGPIVRSRGVEDQLGRRQLDPHQSVLSQIRAPNRYPELSGVGDAYRAIRLYRGWTFGRDCILRGPQRADLMSGEIQEDFANLALVLNRLRHQPKMKRHLVDHFRLLSETFDDFETRVEAGTLEIVLHEHVESTGQERSWIVSAARLSDGTLRYLALLAILLDPQPPPLVCIEEPELGLDASIIPVIAELLKQASQRMQIIVTTHSTLLVEAIKDPDSLLYFERIAGATRVTQGEPTAVKARARKRTRP
ncbi:MAG: AAA family ATPase [Myxococcales bacterium]|nr:AAA family ATPase [Myxococcales bacterium]